MTHGPGSEVDRAYEFIKDVWRASVPPELEIVVQVARPHRGLRVMTEKEAEVIRRAQLAHDLAMKAGEEQEQDKD